MCFLGCTSGTRISRVGEWRGGGGKREDLANLEDLLCISVWSFFLKEKYNKNIKNKQQNPLNVTEINPLEDIRLLIPQ